LFIHEEQKSYSDLTMSSKDALMASLMMGEGAAEEKQNLAASTTEGGEAQTTSLFGDDDDDVGLFAAPALQVIEQPPVPSIAAVEPSFPPTPSPQPAINQVTPLNDAAASSVLFDTTGTTEGGLFDDDIEKEPAPPSSTAPASQDQQFNQLQDQMQSIHLGGPPRGDAAGLNLQPPPNMYSNAPQPTHQQPASYSYATQQQQQMQMQQSPQQVQQQQLMQQQQPPPQQQVQQPLMQHQPPQQQHVQQPQQQPLMQPTNNNLYGGGYATPTHQQQQMQQNPPQQQQLQGPPANSTSNTYGGYLSPTHYQQQQQQPPPSPSMLVQNAYPSTQGRMPVPAVTKPTIPPHIAVKGPLPLSTIVVNEPLLVQSSSSLLFVSSPPHWTYQIMTQLHPHAMMQQQQQPQYSNQYGAQAYGGRYQQQQQQQQQNMLYVRRRFRHVVALEDRLRDECPGAILPPRYVVL
jgi:hypothetical protein